MPDQRCRPCCKAMRWIGELWSVACRWLWGLDQAIRGLDDAREAQELQEALVAHRRYRARMEAAIADGRITMSERAELQMAGAIAERELLDLVRLDERENELHAQIVHCNTRARAAVAPLSRAEDRAEAESYHAPREAPADVWAGLAEAVEAEIEGVTAG